MADETMEKDWQQALEWASFRDEEGKEKLQETACGSDLSLYHHHGLDPQASCKERFREVSLRREKQLWLTFNGMIFFFLQNILKSKEAELILFVQLYFVFSCL